MYICLRKGWCAFRRTLNSIHMPVIKLSLIIATYNRASYLAWTLESLISQQLPPELWEAVVVNNNSIDNTDYIFQGFTVSCPELNLRMVNETRQGLSHARNRGLEEAKGEYIVIMDDDEQANPGFLKAYYDFFTNYPEAAAAGGVMKAVYETEKPKWMSFITERFIGSTINMGGSIKEFPKNKYPIGGNFGFRRSVVDKYGMFDPELGRKGTLLMAGEEKDFIDRIRRGGQKVYYIPDAVIMHSIPASRLTDDYFDRVTRLIGRSERIRTKHISERAYRSRLFSEFVKWCATLVIAIGYVMSMQVPKARYLIRMRCNITRGLLAVEK